MSNIKKGSKLTVSTANGISRATTTSLGVLEVSGPKMSDVTNAYNSNPAHFVVGATDVSGILQVGINNDGNTFIDASVDNNHKDIILQKYGGNTIFGSGSNSTAKVGIGATIPRAPLQINRQAVNPTTATMASSSSQAHLRLLGTGPGIYMDIGLANDSPWGGWIQTHNGNSTDTNSEILLLQPVRGNVGIGTTDPKSKLSVYQGGITLANPVATYSSASVPATSNSLKPFEIRATDGGLGGDWGILRLRAGGGTYMDTCSFIDIVGFNSTDSVSIKFFTSNSERMRINGSGNVGIGTTNPGSYRLAVHSGRSQFYYRQDDGATENLMHLKTSTSVWGHSEPQLLIESEPRGYNTTYATIELQGSEGGSQSWRSVNYGCGIRARGGYVNREYADLSIWTTNSSTNAKQDVMTINSNSHVGIGTTNPSAKLHIFNQVATNDTGNSSFPSYDTRVLLKLESGYNFDYDGASGGIHEGGVAIGFHTFNAFDSNTLYQNPFEAARITAVCNNFDNLENKGDLLFLTNHNGAVQMPTDSLNTDYERMRITYNGNVGIGTNYPKCRLNTNVMMTTADNTIPTYTSDISGNKTVDLFLGKSSPSAQNYWGMWMGTVYQSPYGSYIQTGSNTAHYPLSLQPKGGNVGIGTTNPLSLLHIETDAANVGTTEGDNVGSHNEIEALRISSMGDTGDVNSISSKISLISHTNSQIVPHGKLLFYLNNGARQSNNYGYTPDNMVMSLVGSGNVGIGTTNPYTKLESSCGTFASTDENNPQEYNTTPYANVSAAFTRNNSDDNNHFGLFIGNLASTGNSYLQNLSTKYNAYYDILLQPNGGNVGIGTTQPLSLLTVGSHALTNGTRDLIRLTSYRHNEGFVIRNNDDANTGRLEFFWGNSQNGSGGHDGVVDASILTMVHNGKVGIGTTNPGAKLEVKGDALNNGAIYIKSYATTDKTFELRIRDDTTSSYPLHIGPINSFHGININNSNGNVGIGTADPNVKLQVYGGSIAICNDHATYPSIQLVRIGTSDVYGNDAWGDCKIENYGGSCLIELAASGESNSPYAAFRATATNAGGNVVVGYATSVTPKGQLHIHSNVGTKDNPNSAGNPAMFIGDANNGLYLNVGTNSGGTTAAFGLNWVNNSGVNADADNALVLRTYDGDNRVGIGTMNPNSLFHIYTNENRGNTNTTNKTMLTIESATTDDCNINNFNPISIDFVMGDNQAPKGIARIGSLMAPTGTSYNVANGEAATALTFSTQDDDSGSSLEERMRIGHNGNVGIGTTDPEYKLHVDGTLAIGTSTTYGEPLLKRSTGSTDFFSLGFSNGTSSGSENVEQALNVTRKGYVGIGTTNPRAKLNITDGSGNTHIRITAGYHQGNPNQFIYPALSYYARFDGYQRTEPTNGALSQSGCSSCIAFVDSPGTYTYANNIRTSEIAFFTGQTFFNGSTFDIMPYERMRINRYGSVGIGTTNPNERLHVIGNAVFQMPSSSTDYISSSTHGINLIPYGGDSGGNAGGRIFFDETVNGLHNYGFSLGYNGGADSAILNWESNTFNINRHDENDNGLKVISIDRDTSDFNSNGVQIFCDHPTSTTDNNLGTILSFKSPFTSSIKEEGGFKFVMDDTFLGTTIYPRLSINSFQGSGTLWEINAMTFKTTSSSNVNVGIGTPDVSACFHVRRDVTSGSTYQDLVGDPFPGSTTACFHIRDTNYASDNEYGIVMGTEVYYGKSWIQSKRLSGAYNNYQLLLNPDGGNVGIGTTDATETLHVNGSVGAGYKNTGAHPSTITNGYNWGGSTWNDDGTITWKTGTGGTAGGMAPRGGWDANTTYILTVESKTTGGSYTLGGTTFNPGTSYSTQVKEFTGSLGEMRNNWGSYNEITFKRWDVSIKNKKMLNVNRLGGVGINDDRVYDEDFGHLYVDSNDFPTLRRGGRDYTSRSVLTVGGSMILSTISGGNDLASSNIYFNAPNAAFQTGLIWRRENPGNITYISGAILFDSELQNYSTGTTTGYSAGGLSFYTSDSGNSWSSSSAKRRMVIHGDGNVGIGTTSPSYPLHVAGGTNGSWSARWFDFLTRISTATGTDPFASSGGNNRRLTNQLISIHSQYAIWAATILAASDRRIKKNIVDVSDNQALNMLRNIPSRYYEYKDPVLKGEGKTIGFIAQEVREVMPMAINIEKSIIPNEMRQLDTSWNDTTLTTDLQDASGVKYKFYVSNKDDFSDEIEKEIIGNADNSFTFDASYNNVFCYGKEVDDFHTLDKQKLFALNFSATQEIDRIQQQQVIDISNANATIQTLQTDLSNANATIQQQATTIQTLETQIADILTRLSNLENSSSS